MITKALLIGIQNYGLDGPHEDIKNMTVFIKQMNPNIKDNMLHILMDKPGFVSPTKKNILYELEHLYDDVKEDQDVVIYYSGHGDNVISKDKDEFDKRYDQAMRVLGGRILDNHLNEMVFKNIPKGTSCYCIFDCCHSGDILDLKYKLIDKKFREIRPSDKDHSNKVVLISGCGYMQSTTDAPKGGAFTNRFLDIMREYRNEVTYKILFMELDYRLNYLEKYFGMSQDPQMFGSYEIDSDNYIFK